MKILVVDRDELSAQLLRSKLEPVGHEVEYEADKNNIVEQLTANQYEVICLDPSPLTSPRPVVLNVRRSVGNYPYIFLMGEGKTQEEAISAGTNDILSKPLDASVLDEKLENARRLTNIIKNISDDSEDFPSAGGVISKSAFNQLFLSGIDRADRYGEKSYVLFFSIDNYKEINYQDGTYAADYAVAKLSHHLVRLRRQSDIIGQVGVNEYALLLQRPVYETEPVEATHRFAEALQSADDIVSEGSCDVQVKLSLIDLPVGQELAGHSFTSQK